MKPFFTSRTKIALLFVGIMLILFKCGVVAAQNESIIYNFASPLAAYSPAAGLVADQNGNFYGTTWGGGSNGTGTVYELQRMPGGTWAENVIFSFPTLGNQYGYAANAVIFDHSGNIYGTTTQGGGWGCGDDQGNVWGCGTVYELSPSTGGGWSETNLYSFLGGTDGSAPSGGLVMDSAGNLYGVTNIGGTATNHSGEVFKISPQSGGGWLKTEIYSFGGERHPEGGPQGPLAIDAAGNLYGAAEVIYKLSLDSQGMWVHKVLYDFGAHDDGEVARGGLIFDTAGNLYGTTGGGGKFGNGTAFKLIPAEKGQWSEIILHSFDNMEGNFPAGNLAMDNVGDLYGTLTASVSPEIRRPEGGCLGGAIGCGLVYELRSRENGFEYKILHHFAENGVDGYFPLGGVTLDASGKLYGTTIYGGTGNLGIVYELSKQK